MGKEIAVLKPKQLWKHFYNLTQIPRPSKKEKEAIVHIRAFADELNLQFIEDSVGNLIVKKPARPGCEGKKTIVLQSHVDMVPQKNSNKIHDFEKDAIETIVDGDWVRANDTTLGSDNGIGVAAIMALLESSDINHGPLEALFTINEEAGMEGAFGLDEKALSGKVLLNLDSEDEGELYVGCAGGIDVNVNLDLDTVELSEEKKFFRIVVQGLKGGHSGLDINLGRGNSNKILGQLIVILKKKIEVYLHEFSGGNLRNAIPREAHAILGCSAKDSESFKKLVNDFSQDISLKLGETDPDLKITVAETELENQVLNEESFKKFCYLIDASPNGVIAMSKELKGVTETSVNLAIINLENGKSEFKFLARSSSENSKNELAENIKDIFEKENAKVSFAGSYPGWQPDPDSEVLAVFKDVYKNNFNKEAKVKVIHAGLECGIIGAKYTGMDMISFGPTIRFPHSPDEKVNIPTVDAFWKLLVKAVEAI